MRMIFKLIIVYLIIMSSPVLAAGLSYKEQIRQQAEHDCYDDVQRLCSKEIPDEDRVTACMKTNQRLLSPACAKVFHSGVE